LNDEPASKGLASDGQMLTQLHPETTHEPVYREMALNDPFSDNPISQHLALAWHGFINCVGHESNER
jgi:hypothetical protein